MVMGVIGFIMSLIAVMAYTGVTAWQKQSTRLQMENQAQNFMYILTEKLRQAQPGTVSISNVSGEMNESEIYFNLVGQNNPVTFCLKTVTGTGGAQDRKILFFDPEYTGNTTTATYLAGGQVLASNVISLYFTYPNVSDTSRILVSLSLQKYPFKNKPPVYYQASEEVYVRN
ncbi:MAG TPA: hypothetical protein VJ873_06145 [bacterium]|nr:hypothetical protein [bacterium]